MASYNNISELLYQQADRYPEKPCLIQAVNKKKYQQLSYRQFVDRVEQAVNGLGSLDAGTITVLALPFGVDYCALVFALFRLGAVPMFIDPRMGLANLRRCLRAIPPQAVIGTRFARLVVQMIAGKQIVARFCPADCFGEKKIATLATRQQQLAALATRQQQLAAITFTSGSTGSPKAVCYSHQIFCAQTEALAKIFSVDPSSYDLATFPLFALFGPLLGRTTVLPYMDMTRPARAKAHYLYRAINKFSVRTMFCSPAVLDNLASYGQQKVLSLTTIRQILCAGAPVNSRIIKAVSPLLTDDAQVLTPYGATEVLPVAVVTSKTLMVTSKLTAQGKGICVGQAIAEVDLRIIEQEDDGIGEIIVAAPWLTNYYNNEVNARSKIVIEGKVFHRMGDVGYLDDQGQLWYCGRKSQQVLYNDKKLSTICYEGIFNNHPVVKRSALIGIDGQSRIVVCIERLHYIAKDRLCTELQELAQEFSLPVIRFIIVRRLPVDKRHNAKIQREVLQRRFACSTELPPLKDVDINR